MKVHIMGSDQRIVRCARVSFAKDEEVDKERDTRLIRYLFQHKHASPFEHVIIAFEAAKSFGLKSLKTCQVLQCKFTIPKDTYGST